MKISCWPLEFVKPGDRVMCLHKTTWGEGIVVEAQLLGTLQFKHGNTTHTFTHQENSHGQRVSVKFTDGRTRTLLTPVTPLKVIDGGESNKTKK
jgi:hypothetical protein